VEDDVFKRRKAQEDRHKERDRRNRERTKYREEQEKQRDENEKKRDAARQQFLANAQWQGFKGVGPGQAPLMINPNAAAPPPPPMIAGV
jgi:hypothetical protein